MKDQILEQEVQKAIEGNAAAVRFVCERKARDILYVSHQLLGNIDDAEDVAQDVLIHLHRNISSLREASAFNVWLYQIIRRMCLNMMKKSQSVSDKIKHIVESTQDDETVPGLVPDHIRMDKEKKIMLLRVVEQFSFQRKMCLLMFYYEGMSYEEIAKSMNITKKTVGNVLMGAKQLIGQRLEGEAEQQKETTLAMDALSVAAIMEQALEYGAEAYISGDSIARTIAGYHRVCLGLKPGNNGSRIKDKLPAEAGTKITVGIVVTGGVLSLGMAAYLASQNGNQEAAIDPVMEQEAVVSIVEEPDTEEPEKEIRTLEDMIGPEEADRLREYAGAGHIERSDLEEFLESLGLVLEETIWNPVIRIEHALYAKTRQQKRLMVILRHDLEADICEAGYCFTEADEPLPDNVEIDICFLNWKEEDVEDIEEGW